MFITYVVRDEEDEEDEGSIIVQINEDVDMTDQTDE
jgi:hypothetical protein